jgi:hypothetical protein
MKAVCVAVYITLGYINGQKLLPLPPAWELEEALAASKAATPRSHRNRADASETVNFLEAIVTGWMHMVKDMLTSTREQALEVCVTTNVPYSSNIP